ncbi:MAG: LytTR family DNA-binding domain-containing protein [Clostridia bacterium]|jgi:DNA-binding LytR/AlgR family response regulator|nr:LytTR family DNA-binding domain-containing protein [Clostridia bacterium]
MNFIICDDKRDVVETISEALVKIIRENEIEANIALKCTKPDDVMEYIKNPNEGIDVYILDVALCDELNGFDLAKAVRDVDPLSYVMFITGHIELSTMPVKYNIKPFEYLIKPVKFKEFEGCIKRLEKDYKKSLDFLNMNMQKTILVSSGYKEYNVLVKDILFIESSAQKLIIHMRNSVLECYGSLTDMEAMLKDNKNTFYRAHKSFIVNMNHISILDLANQQLVMNNEEIVCISRKKKKEFKELFKAFTGESRAIK